MLTFVSKLDIPSFVPPLESCDCKAESAADILSKVKRLALSVAVSTFSLLNELLFSAVIFELTFAFSISEADDSLNGISSLLPEIICPSGPTCL